MYTRHQIINASTVKNRDMLTSNALRTDKIHVWQSLLDDSDELLDEYTAILNQAERERSEKFKFKKHKNYYITGRAKLRNLIAQYTSIPPRDIQFQYNKYGKPFLESIPLKFNISHSKNEVVYCLNLENEIGVDIEVINKHIEIDKLAKRFFSKQEAATILGLTPDVSHAYFFRCWTRKEAFIKAHGEGLSIPLDQFQVNILPEKDVAINKIEWDPDSLKNWNLYSFAYSDSSIYAVALSSHMRKKIVHFRY